jgi:hypothetical protein
MAVKTRKEVREQLGSVLSTALTGVGNPAQAVYDYMKSSFDGQSPVVAIGSGGTQAHIDVQQFGGDWFPVYWFEILSFVVRDEDEENAEDTLDTLSQNLYETLETNTYLAGYWERLSYGERSTIAPASVGGDPYWLETTEVMVEVFG